MVPKSSVRASVRQLRRNAVKAIRMARLAIRRPGWVRWNERVGKRISGADLNQRLRLGFPADVITAARMLGVELAFQDCSGWAAVLESDSYGYAKIYVDCNTSIENQRYLIALALGYLLHTPPATVVRLRLTHLGRAKREDTLDGDGQRAMLFAIQLMLPYHRRRIKPAWLASQAHVPIWFAEQGIRFTSWQNDL